MIINNSNTRSSIEGFDPMTQPTPADARVRALRTLFQNLVIDVLVAIIIVVMPAIQSSSASIDWRLLLASLVKTVLVTLLSYGQRYLEARRAGTV
jgi:hypothetical protein